MWGHLEAAEIESSSSARVRVICIPSTDGTFAWAVQRALASGTVRRIGDLQATLHQYYPLVLVRARELSGEPAPTWYAYRDGGFPYRDGGRPAG
jgi:hypothetical protein